MAHMTLPTGKTVWLPAPAWRPRVVAVDEDGTFLRTSTSYNVERFERLWGRLAAAGVRFVVASGNQYWQIRDFFPTHAHEIAYVSSNGSYVEDQGGTCVFAASADPKAVRAVIDAVHATPELPFLMSGVHGAYVERTADAAFVKEMGVYFHRLAVVDDLAEVRDQIFMFSTHAAEGASRDRMERFARAAQGAFVPVYSGDGYFDLIIPGVNKAAGLAMLCDRWGIAAADVAAFGDSENDLEMLRWAGGGYAMENAPANVKAAAAGVAPANTEDGVLQLLEAWFAHAS